MRYSLFVRALVGIKRKEKAAAQLARCFPGLPIKIVGRYWKDNSLWEATGEQEFEYVDDKTAVWETLRYFSRMGGDWIITTGPTDPPFDTLLSVVSTESHLEPRWCHYDLIRLQPKE